MRYLTIVCVLSITILLILGQLSIGAQTYGNKEFYIVDSLNLELIQENEKLKLDSILELYHNCDKSNDTLSFYFLEQLVSGFESDGIELNYRYEYLKETNEIDFSKNYTDVVRKRLNFAKGYAYANVAVMLAFNDRQDSALYYAETGMPYMSRSDSSNYSAILCNIASYCCKNLGRLNQAIDFNMQALSLAEKSKDSAVMSSVYNNLAKLHRSLGNYDKSEFHYNNVLLTSKKNKMSYGIALVNYAELLYKDKNEVTKAKGLLLKSKALIDTDSVTHLSTGHAEGVYNLLGEIYLDEKKYELAKESFLISLKYSKMAVNTTDQCQNNIGLAKVNCQIENYSEAKKHAVIALDIATENSLHEEISSANKVLYQIYNKTNEPQKALYYLESHIKETKVLKQEKDKKKILQKNFQYDYDTKVTIDSLRNKQKLDIAKVNEGRANEKAEKSRMISLLSVSIVIITLLLLGYILSRIRIIRQQKKELNIAYNQLEVSKKHELAASNLKAIKSQMNPHFIFNSINSIQDLVLQQETLKSYDYLVVFSKLVREILDFSEREFIPLEEEITFLETYLGLEKLRFQDEFNFKITSDLTSESVLIPSLIIQPFAENAIKHGLLHKDGEKELLIDFTENENGIICMVSDNGVGKDVANEIKKRRGVSHQSFSTEAIYKRLKLLEEQTNSNAGYESKTLYSSIGNVIGTKVIITLPIK